MNDPSGHYSLPSWVSYVLSFTGLAGLAGAALLYYYQCDLIYPADVPEGSRKTVAKPSDFDIPYTEDILTTKDNVKLQTYTMVLEDENEARMAPTILYFQANAGNIGHRLPIAKVFYRKLKCNVVMLSYRGYGLSEGKPNEKGIRIDCQRFLEYVQSHPVLKDTRLVAYGQSIGGAVAIDLVSRNEDAFSGLIVENTFLSIQKLIPHVMPFLKYLAFLCHQHWPSETSVQRIVNTPVLFISGSQDEMVPPAHMVKLHELCGTREGKEFVEMPRGKHNDTCLQPGYYTAVREFLERWVLKEERRTEEDRDEATKATDMVHEIEGREKVEAATPENFKQSVLQGLVSKAESANNNKEEEMTARGREPFQLVSGLADSEGMTHSFQIEEIELEEE